MVILSPLTQSQKTAIQLAHNKLVGEDDQNLLKQLYDTLESADEKLYSGLTDDDFKMEDVALTPISFIQVQTEEVVIAFLPEHKEEVLDWLKTLEKRAEKKTFILADRKDFDAFFSTMVAVKQTKNVLNHATAIRALIDLAQERLDQLSSKDDGTQTDSP